MFGRVFSVRNRHEHHASNKLASLSLSNSGQSGAEPANIGLFGTTFWEMAGKLSGTRRAKPFTKLKEFGIAHSARISQGGPDDPQGTKSFEHRRREFLKF